MTSKVTGEGDDADDVKKSIAIFAYKQRLLSIEMKTNINITVAHATVILILLWRRTTVILILLWSAPQ